MWALKILGALQCLVEGPGGLALLCVSGLAACTVSQLLLDSSGSSSRPDPLHISYMACASGGLFPSNRRTTASSITPRLCQTPNKGHTTNTSQILLNSSWTSLCDQLKSAATFFFNSKTIMWKKKKLNLNSKFGRLRKTLPLNFLTEVDQLALDGVAFQKEEKVIQNQGWEFSGESKQALLLG